MATRDRQDAYQEAPLPDRPTWQALRRLGLVSWSILGIVGLLVAVGYVASLLWLVVVPLVLALFPATLLVPVTGWLKRRGAPDWAASLVTIVAGTLLLGLLIVAMIPFVAAELPEVAQSAAEGLQDIEELIQQVAPGTQLTDLLGSLREGTGAAGDVAGQALDAAVLAFETLAGVLLLLVALFFYLKDGSRLMRGMTRLMPRDIRPRAEGAARRAWETVGAYFQGQLFVALVDAVLIGLGLYLLGIPLALPLAVLIFFGGLFPIVGAAVTGSLAVLVAFAHGGLGLGLGVAALVLAVQQIESNLLEPLILGRVLDLHPLVVILAITAGALLMGVLGAFLAVPVAATVSRTAQYLLGEEEPA
jgi:putative heme transporter